VVISPFGLSLGRSVRSFRFYAFCFLLLPLGSGFRLKIDAQIGTIPVITTVAGNGTTCNQGICGDGGLATSANLYFPYGVAVDSSGDLYIADFVDNRIRKVTAGTGIITTVVGNGVQCPTATNACGDSGAALSASLYNPTGIAIDNARDLFIADGSDQRVRKVAAGTGIITTGDGDAATCATLYYPSSSVLDSAGNVYIADSGDSRIRKTSLSTGLISALAGNGLGCSPATASCGDSGPATSSELASLSGEILDVRLRSANRTIKVITEFALGLRPCKHPASSRRNTLGILS
jgi:hypothetical protein